MTGKRGLDLVDNYTLSHTPPHFWWWYNRQAPSLPPSFLHVPKIKLQYSFCCGLVVAVCCLNFQRACLETTIIPDRTVLWNILNCWKTLFWCTVLRFCFLVKVNFLADSSPFFYIIAIDQAQREYIEIQTSRLFFILTNGTEFKFIHA